MRSLNLFFAIAGSLFFASSSQAFTLIDDFTVGDYHSVIVWPNKHDGIELFGLDPEHSALGRRAVDVTVNTNFDKVPVNIDIGGGQARISYQSPSRDIATDTVMEFGALDGPTIDLSKENEIWVDLFTEDPSGRLADQWSVTMIDSLGHVDTNPGWLFRPGGVRFRKQDFDPLMDWGKIRLMNFRQKFTPDIGDVPMAYTVTKIYAVPEPGTAAFATVLLWPMVRASWRKRRSVG